jgi:hypothetical protein
MDDSGALGLALNGGICRLLAAENGDISPKPGYRLDFAIYCRKIQKTTMSHTFVEATQSHNQRALT